MFLYIHLRSEPDEIRSIAPTTAIDEHKKDCKKDEDRALSLPAKRTRTIVWTGLTSLPLVIPAFWNPTIHPASPTKIDVESKHRKRNPGQYETTWNR